MLALPLLLGGAFASGALVFSAGFTSDMELERDVQSAVYGLVDGGSAAAAVQVALTDSSGAAAPATVTAAAVLSGDGSMCDHLCVANGNYCRDGRSCCATPSCSMGCILAAHTPDVDTCKQKCALAIGQCESPSRTGRSRCAAAAPTRARAAAVSASASKAARTDTETWRRSRGRYSEQS